LVENYFFYQIKEKKRKKSEMKKTKVKKMSEKRIKYETSPVGPRLIALVIDFVIPIPILTLILQWGVSLEWELFWKRFIFVDVEFSEVALILLVLMFILSILVYFIVVPSLTDGQTLGKIVMGLNVVYDDNSSTKKKFITHIKRLFFMRQGTKVVKIVDERPEGL
jgi:hypothetical protein